MVQPDMPLVTAKYGRMRFACWITEATDTHSEYVILVAFPRTHPIVTKQSTLPVVFASSALERKLFVSGHCGNQGTYGVHCQRNTIFFSLSAVRCEKADHKTDWSLCTYFHVLIRSLSSVTLLVDFETPKLKSFPFHGGKVFT